MFPKPRDNRMNTRKNLECDYCRKRFVDGYDLTIYTNRQINHSEAKHFCSINCLARWVGERGWLYELHLKGIHTPELVVEHPIQYAGKNG